MADKILESDIPDSRNSKMRRIFLTSSTKKEYLDYQNIFLILLEF